MKKLLLSVWMLIAAFVAFGQQKYLYRVDLQNVKNDQVKITLIPPKIEQDEIVFVMPKVIPGSYSQKDYGRFITDFKAIAKNGKKLKVKVQDKNDFYIKDARHLDRIEYKVNDTWDDNDLGNFVFQPGGSNIEAGKNFVLNNNAFFGYFEGMKMLPYELHVTKPAGMYGSTYLPKQTTDATHDVLLADNFVKLVDSPIMYCKPDTTSFQAANTRVHVSVYSPNRIGTAEKVAGYLQPLANALGRFFVTMPVNEYHFIFYFSGREQKVVTEVKGGMGGFGALEHNYSSFYLLPEMDYESAFKAMILQVAGHEFLHILTPLNIHSHEIEDFDFRNPKMSQHLWMYEGVTEYFSWLVQVRDSIVTREAFVEEMRSKIVDAEKSRLFSFTDMSKNVLTKENQQLYTLVYTRGAVQAFLLDIYLSRLSNGTYGLKELMMDLAKKYGANRPFNDDELFEEIYKLTYPEIKDFFTSYIIGSQQLDYDKFLEMIGYDFDAEKKKRVFYFGNLNMKYENEKFVFTQVEKNALGIENGDILVSIDGTEIKQDNAKDLIKEYFFDNEDRSKATLRIVRNGKSMQLSGNAWEGTMTIKNAITERKNPTPAQVKLRNFLFTGIKQ